MEIKAQVTRERRLDITVQAGSVVVMPAVLVLKTVRSEMLTFLESI